MFKNSKFAFNAVMIMILGVLYMFFYSGLQNDHINVITPALQAANGWSDLKITNPITAAAIFVIIFYLIVGVALIKIGIKKILVPSTILIAVGCAMVAFAGESYGIYAVGVFLIRTLVVPLQMGIFMLAANWFIKYRGRVLGLVTAGSPLFSIIGLSVLTSLVNGSMGLSSYYILAVILIALGVLTQIFIKDTPEEAGLFPDGGDHAPTSEDHIEATDISLSEILKDKRAWQLIISYGILQFVIIAMMAYMAIRWISLTPEGAEGTLWSSMGLKWLAIGAAAGIPMSYVLGYIDDKLGSVWASIVLTFLYLFAVIPLAIMPVGGSDILAISWAFGVACMTGGMPTMHPCITSYVYGRKLYMAANKWIMTIQAIPAAFAVAYMGLFNQAGNLSMAYYIMLGMLAVCFVTLLTMFKIPDANAADRAYVKK